MSSKEKENYGKNSRPKVYIVGGGFEYIRMMYNLGYDGAKDLDDADIVLFTGGEDVNPELYGEHALARTHFNRLRDQKETEIYHEAVRRGYPMVGICRGGQFLNVMNGGKMWQHVTNHTRSHIARVEVPPLKGDKRRTVMVTSTHHQMMIPTDEAVVLLTATEAYERSSPSITKMGKSTQDDPDIEAVFYDQTASLCFQPHPEIPSATPELVDLFEEFMNDFVVSRILRDNATAQSIIDQIPEAL